MKRFPWSLLPLLLLAAAALPVLAAEPVPEIATTDHSESWSLAQTVIEPSGKVRWGQLDNGLRYAIMPHGSPAGRISMRLLVTVGSIHEREEQRGYAHFVEHMAFNGTRNFPAGELLKFLQRMGATSQAHQNASTSHTRTLYKLELPENSVTSLEKGLGIFRDFADGILFQPAEVKRERGVILSEALFREQPGEVRRLALTELLFAGTRIAERQPIGLIPYIEQADARSLRQFYDAWYRPENMCVVVVGEIDAATAAAKVRAAFASLVARGQPGEVASIGTIRPISEPRVLSEADQMGGFHLSLIKVVPRQPTPFTWGAQLEGRRLHTAFRMLARRLESLTHASPRIISDSGASVEVEFDEFRQLMVKVSSSAQDWDKALGIAEQEVRRVIEHGFTPDELAYQQTILREQIRNAAASFTTIPSSDLADEITLSLEKRHPIFFADEALEPALALIDQLTIDECQRSFREHWGNEPPRIFITTPAANIQPAEVVRSAFAASDKIPVALPESVTAAAFAYEDFGPAGEVISKAHRADLDVWLVRFENDVRLNIKRTAFESGVARFNVRVGMGAVSEPEAKPGLRFWTGELWLGGVGKHSVSELSQMVQGLQSISTSADDDAFAIKGHARTEHLPRALKQVTALVTDPAFRTEGHESMASNLRGHMHPLWEQPEGPVQRFILPSLASGDPRIGIPDPNVVFAHTSADLRAWLEPQLQHGPIEIAVVGDVAVDTVIAAVAETFGTLPTRAAKASSDSYRKVHIPKQSVSTYYYYTGPAERPSTLEFFWPIRKKISSADQHRLWMLALILEDRLSVEVREKKGATYSPRAFYMRNETHQGFSFLRCALEVRAEDAVQYGDVVRGLADKLAKAGVKADELARAKAQYSAGMKASVSDNPFWLFKISAAQEKPALLDDLLSAADDIARTSTKNLDALARKYLRADQGFRYIIEPNARMPKLK